MYLATLALLLPLYRVEVLIVPEEGKLEAESMSPILSTSLMIPLSSMVE